MSGERQSRVRKMRRGTQIENFSVPSLPESEEGLAPVPTHGNNREAILMSRDMSACFSSLASWSGPAEGRKRGANLGPHLLKLPGQLAVIHVQSNLRDAVWRAGDQEMSHPLQSKVPCRTHKPSPSGSRRRVHRSNRKCSKRQRSACPCPS